MRTFVFYATANSGKMAEIAKHLDRHNIRVHSAEEYLTRRMFIPETGTTLSENALIKVKAYMEGLIQGRRLYGDRAIVIGDDTGLEIQGLNGEPGIKVRRWKGHVMTDEEIIAYALERMAGLSGEARSARFTTAIAVMSFDHKGNPGEPYTFEGSLDGRIREIPDPRRTPGLPFESLFEIPKWGLLLADLATYPEQMIKSQKMFNHRERALDAAIPTIRKLMGPKTAATL